MNDGIKRREFLKVLGVTGAGVGLVGCSTDRVEQLIPYVVPPEEITPGVATWYATACGECPAGCGTWVKTREGRAIKLDGNPAHPVSGGALCSRGHSALQGLYDPDRLTGPTRRTGDTFSAITWAEAGDLLASSLASAGANVLLLSGRQGPTLTRLEEAWAGALGGRRVEFEPLSHASLREASRMAFGTDEVPTFDFEAARIIFSFGADFLETWLSPVEHSRGFARMSGTTDGFEKGRLVAIGPRLSLTGQNADEWVPVDAGSEALVALAMANVLAREGADAGPYATVLQAYDPASVASQVGVTAEALEGLARRFVTEGPGLAVGPGVAGQGRNATAANLAVLILNAVGGAVGRTLHPGSGHLSAPSSSAGDLASAIAAMQAGQVAALVIHEANPAYSLPPGAGFAAALGSVGFKVVISDRLDETARLADLVLPKSHWLESWGDSNPRPGLWTVQQPAMRTVPHFDSRPVGDILLTAARRLGQDLGSETFYDYLRAGWSDLHAAAGSPGGTFDEFWREALRSGVVELPSIEPIVPVLQTPDRALAFEAPALDGEGLALVVYPSSRFGDGRGANRPWLQELPDPVSKISWHSWVELHPETVSELGLRSGDIVRVISPHGEVEVPVYPYPGIRRNTAAVAMGGGHTSFGRWADGRGVNPMVLLPSEIEQPSGALVHLATRVRIEPTGEWRRLATVAGADNQQGRPIAPAVELAALRSGAFEAPERRDLEELQGVGGFVPVPTDGAPEAFPLPGARHGEYDPEAFPRWAMAIDLDKCTGCSACVTACQSENNVAWVGEDQMMMGRDLQWIRLERYYEGINADEPGLLDVRFLPMLCQHCGNAPCEPVCPVYAAYHTPDGLNAQVYNRCVGTRYCANNCPYKVRVFNWFAFSEIPEPMNWQYNPDVTVRGEGVMEKCSFCVQRIRQAEHRATLEGRGVTDGQVVPACQQSCPAEAIVFGNIRDPNSRVAQVTANERTYRVLDVLINTQPAVNYLRKVTFHPVEEIEV
ncbi:MAG: 4Fe-4S dicluster domain-containing protein [Gemmatimonadetes bacterium]|nr:4Fe-4S dicluster domain-containing protein [Gemmatimonadota bacterium]